MSFKDPGEFIRANTAIASPSLLPELRLHLATEVTPLWLATEATLEREQLPPPYWAFAWPGGQALAKYVLEHPEIAKGRNVLDFGAGSGLVAIAAALAGAQKVTAAEIDLFAAAVIDLNAKLNEASVEIEVSDVIETPHAPWDLILVGDMCYEKPLADRLTAWLRKLAAKGCLVLLGDPGRTYVPTSGLTKMAQYVVPTRLDLEDKESRTGIVWRLEPLPEA